MDRRYDRLLTRVHRRGGFLDRAEAERALRATIEVLGARLDDAHTRAVADELPEPLASWMRAVDHTGEFTVDELVDLVRRTEGVAPGFAREHVLVVGEAIGEEMGREVRVRLAHRLGDEWGAVFDPFERRGSRPSPHPHRTLRSNLAAGRPGSSHPLSESAPHPEQRHSIAGEDDPHGDRKLSSGAAGEDLARAHPRNRPVSGG